MTEEIDYAEANLKIAEYCGAVLKKPKSDYLTPLGYFEWKAENGPLKGILNGYMNHASFLRFDRDWKWLMAAFETVANKEKKLLMKLLIEVAGNHSNSITDMFENLYLHILNQGKDELNIPTKDRTRQNQTLQEI